ncbi:NAD-dependent epimerase/dehydratase family protein [Polaribacter aestuariivivens]|uniref:NAD-dependent epimerase/dehydratase family protein n=1 Tax=Polaribacter aestuariivivens TaxID=2304626 RepID=A0A5S3N730_9FLAO|nr:NAD(P)H-binding protein [Polaribacter aestuariivivens]TMM31093.1 NAD-dependent epimerase/dehydratase family protein [Polaribacter aestuariivivens]
MSKTAIILGATGLTGGILLEKLLADKRYSTIKLFSRSSVEVASEKIQEFIVDLLQLENHSKDFTGDEVYCCIGTTASKTKDKEKYKKIDYGIPVTAAKLSKQNGIETFVVMSSMGANPDSSVFYNRTKGEMERDVLQLKIKNTFILRPSLIGGNRDEKRIGEKIGKIIMSILNPLFVGALKKYRMIHPEKIASCMKILANKPEKEVIISSDKILLIANTK